MGEGLTYMGMPLIVSEHMPEGEMLIIDGKLAGRIKRLELLQSEAIERRDNDKVTQKINALRAAQAELESIPGFGSF